MPRSRNPLPAYTPEELLKYGKSFAATFEVPDDVSEDMAAEFAMAALAAGEKAKPGRGIRSYQCQAGECNEWQVCRCSSVAVSCCYSCGAYHEVAVLLKESGGSGKEGYGDCFGAEARDGGN